MFKTKSFRHSFLPATISHWNSEQPPVWYRVQLEMIVEGWKLSETMESDGWLQIGSTILIRPHNRSHQLDTFHRVLLIINQNQASLNYYRLFKSSTVYVYDGTTTRRLVSPVEFCDVTFNTIIC